MLDASVWLASVDEATGLEVDCSAAVDKLSGVDMLVSPDELVGVRLPAVGEFETDCPDELALGSLVDSARLEEITVLVTLDNPEMDIEPLADRLSKLSLDRTVESDGVESCVVD